MIVETFARVFVEADAIDATIAFYIGLTAGRQSLRFSYPEAGLEVAAVSSDRLSVLIVAGQPERRAPFEATRLTIQVDRLESHMEELAKAGCRQLEPIQMTPRGRKTRFRHADGMVVEYVEHHTVG